MMKRLLSILALVLLSAAPAVAQPHGQEHIQWNAGVPLTFADFKGTAPANKRALAIASSNTAINVADRYLQTGHQILKISNTFSTSDSWMNSKTPEVLAHEQGHFDINEIFARKLYHDLLAARPRMNGSNYRAIVDEIFEAVLSELDGWQDRYDHETAHGVSRDPQAAWLDKIRQGLKDYSAYANYPK